MYKVKKDNSISEKFCVEADGKEYIFDVNIDITEQLVKSLRMIQTAMIELEELHKTKPSVEVEEKIGAATIEFISLFFGEENTQKLFEIYKSPQLLLMDIAPFITNVILPKVEQFRKTHLKKMSKTWKRTR
mgnify:CR=1 FL=1